MSKCGEVVQEGTHIHMYMPRPSRRSCFLPGERRLWVGQCRLFVFILVTQNNKTRQNALRQKKVSFAAKGAFGPNSTKMHT